MRCDQVEPKMKPLAEIKWIANLSLRQMDVIKSHAGGYIYSLKLSSVKYVMLMLLVRLSKLWCLHLLHLS